MAQAIQKITSVQPGIFLQQAGAQPAERPQDQGGRLDRDTAEDIAHRGLLTSLNVRPELDGDGNETGIYRIPAGGRRYRALERW